MNTLRIDVSIPDFLHRDVEQGVYYCADSILAARVDREHGSGIELDLKDGADHQAVEAAVRRWVEQTVANSLAFQNEALRSWGGPPAFRADAEEVAAHPEVRLMGEGIAVFGPGLTRVFRALVEICERIAADAGADPLTLPSVATLEHLQRCDFLRQFPQAISFVTHFREDFAVIDAYSKQCASAEHDHDCQPLSGDLQPFARLLRPAVCYHVYPYFEHKQLRRDPELVCALGDCFRYESRNTIGLERLFNFRLYEIVALGSEGPIRSWRDAMVERAIELFEALELPGAIRASNDPFFAGSSVLKSTFQRAHDLKLELQVPFPNREGHLGVASFNMHRDFFGARYGIRDVAGETAGTGCTGYGIDRMLACLLAHHGLDLERWPDRCRETLGLGS